MKRSIRFGGIMVALLVASFHGASAAEWEMLPVGDTDFGRVRLQELAVSPADPTRLFACSSLFYRTTDGGVSWLRIDASFEGHTGIPALTRLQFDRTDPDRAWCTVGGVVYWTTDFGDTWSIWGEPPAADPIVDFIPGASNPDHLAAVTDGLSGNLYRTSDGGATWEAPGDALVGLTPRALTQKLSAPDHLAVATEEGVAVSTDAGASWARSLTDQVVSDVEWEETGVVLRARAGDRQRDHFLSTDDGSTWAPHPAGIAVWTAWTLAFDPGNFDDLVYVSGDYERAPGGASYGYYQTLHRSSDAGSTWSEETFRAVASCTPGLPFRAPLSYGGEVWAWLGLPSEEFGNLWHQSSPTADWAEVSAGFSEWAIRDVQVGAAGELYASLAISGSCNKMQLSRSTDGGTTWSMNPTYSESQSTYWSSFLIEFDVSVNAPGYVATTASDDGHVGEGTVSLSTDGGLTWIADREQESDFVSIGHGSGATIYANRWGLHRSTDGGETFESVSDPPVDEVVELLVTPESDLEVFALGGDGSVHQSTDGGSTWRGRSAGLPTGRSGETLLMDPTDGDHLVVVLDGGTLFESKDRGESWSPYFEATVGGPRSSGLVTPAVELRGATILDAAWDVYEGRSRVFLATVDGIWRSDRGFVAGPVGPPVITSLDYSAVHQRLYAASADAPWPLSIPGGFGVYALDIPSLESEAGGVPLAAPTLGAAPRLTVAPNPFRDATQLRFSLPAAADASVRIYDVQGRLVRTLLSERVEQGERTVTWDSRNDAGGMAAPGVYFLRADLGGTARTERVVRLR